MQKIGLSLQSSYRLPMTDVLPLLRAVGFDAVSPTWQQDVCTKEIVRTAERCGLAVQSLHGPFRGLPELWKSADTPLLRQLLQSVEDCAQLGVPVLVVHSWGGIQYTFQKDSLCFDGFDRLVELAQAKGVQIAFENLEGPEFLQSLMERYKNIPTVGLCWDSGHELCYTPHRDFLKDYGHRLLMTHLNDNYGITHPEGLLQGTDDLHLLAFDGIADWPHTVARLKAARRQEILNFELKIRPKGDRCTTDLYSAIPQEQYFAAAYESACRAVRSYFE